jgi:hypothetical protein
MKFSLLFVFRELSVQLAEPRIYISLLRTPLIPLSLNFRSLNVKVSPILFNDRYIPPPYPPDFVSQFLTVMFERDRLFVPLRVMCNPPPFPPFALHPSIILLHIVNELNPLKNIPHPSPLLFSTFSIVDPPILTVPSDTEIKAEEKVLIDNPLMMHVAIVSVPDEDKEIREVVCPDVACRVRVERERYPVVIGNVGLSLDFDEMMEALSDAPVIEYLFSPIVIAFSS